MKMSNEELTDIFINHHAQHDICLSGAELYEDAVFIKAIYDNILIEYDLNKHININIIHDKSNKYVLEYECNDDIDKEVLIGLLRLKGIKCK